MSKIDIQDFVDAIERRGLYMRGIEIYQHGEQIANYRWAPDYRYPVHSVSKSFTSAAVGIAISEGLFGLHDCIASYFPEFAPADHQDPMWRITVRHLLTMNTGHTRDAMLRPDARGDEDDEPIRFFFSIPLEKEPGTWYQYNGGATYMLSALIQKLTGMTLCDYLKPRIFDPLGIEHPHWETCPQGRNLGCSGLFLKTSEIAKLGLLYLNKGCWEGQQLVPAQWVEESGKYQVNTDPHHDGPDNDYGYGYQWWRCIPGVHAYRADGALGQFAIVFDDLDAVVATSSWERKAQQILDVIWDIIYPKLEANK